MDLLEECTFLHHHIYVIFNISKTLSHYTTTQQCIITKEMNHFIQSHHFKINPLVSPPVYKLYLCVFLGNFNKKDRFLFLCISHIPYNTGFMFNFCKQANRNFKIRENRSALYYSVEEKKKRNGCKTPEDVSSSVALAAAAAAAAAKSLQSCPTLCDPVDSSPPGFPIPGIRQARTLEWVAISFSNA